MNDFFLEGEEWVREMSMEERVERALKLLKDHEPEDGYYLAFSGGKDSCAIDALAKMAGVKFSKNYNNTTIDPPELIRFIKKHHPDTIWHNPRLPMMKRVIEKTALPPTRAFRWCCHEYKEGGGHGRTKIFGVRRDESTARAKRWSEVSKDKFGNKAICPVVHWTDAHLWDFLRRFNVPYCPLYDEGFKRLGCVGCPLTTRENQDREFSRWPNYERNWKRAVVGNWEKHRTAKKRNGDPYSQANFKTADEAWRWWRFGEKTNIPTEHCQTELLWTNAPAQQ